MRSISPITIEIVNRSYLTITFQATIEINTRIEPIDRPSPNPMSTIITVILTSDLKESKNNETGLGV